MGKKQIRLKNGIKIVDCCATCPCARRDSFFGEFNYCELDGTRYEKDCPLEDAEEWQTKLNPGNLWPARSVDMNGCIKENQIGGYRARSVRELWERWRGDDYAGFKDKNQRKNKRT